MRGGPSWGMARGGDLLSRCRSTIGAGELNGRVRDGNGCGLPAVAASQNGGPSAWGIPAGRRLGARRKPHRCGGCGKVKPEGRLVRPGSTRRRACTCRLSTWSSSRAPGGTLVLERASRLDAFSGLSLPHVATLRCDWRHNRCTRGASSPVLSY